MSTSPIWTVHCDSQREVALETADNGQSRAVNPCHSWIGEEDTLVLAQAIARAAGWSVLTRREAYCPPCAALRHATPTKEPDHD